MTDDVSTKPLQIFPVALGMRLIAVCCIRKMIFFGRSIGVMMMMNGSGDGGIGSGAGKWWCWW